MNVKHAETPLLRKPDLGIICAWQSTFCEMMKLGLVVGGGALLPFRRARADDDPHSPPVQPFHQDLPIPPDHEPVSKFSVGAPQPTCTVEVPGLVYDPDPVVDADLYSHAGLVTFGNESTGRWSALPGTMRADQITKAILRRTRPIAQKRP